MSEQIAVGVGLGGEEHRPLLSGVETVLRNVRVGSIYPFRLEIPRQVVEVDFSDDAREVLFVAVLQHLHVR